MAFARLTQQCLPVVCRKTFCDVNKSPFGKIQRNFGFSQIRCNKYDKRTDQIQVDFLSKIALIVDKKYKTLKDVPVFLPYTQVYKARDKFRIKASIASGLFVILLMIFLIRRAQNNRRIEQYEGMMAIEEAKHQKK